MKRQSDAWARRHNQRLQLPARQLGGGPKGVTGRLSVVAIVAIVCIMCIFSTVIVYRTSSYVEDLDVEKLWQAAPSEGWIPSSAPRSFWPSPPEETNGYLRVRCNGGLIQQRNGICNAVVAARIMNATLVLPELDTNSFWNDDSGFSGIYDVDRFIKSLRNDVKIVKKLPEIESNGKVKKMRPFQMRPPRDAFPIWYATEAVEKMKEHGSIYLTPFSHRLAEDLDDPELQRLRCRVNYHALRFKPEITELSNKIVRKLRAEGHFMAIHLRFEMDMISFSGCFKIFSPEEQEILSTYRKKNFAQKELDYDTRRAMGKCPLTPEEVGLILRAMGFDNGTRVFLAAGDLFGGPRFLDPLKRLFPRIGNHTALGADDSANGRLGSAVDYVVCLLADVFLPTYDGPSNFANNLVGHRLYHGFRTVLRPDRKALAPVFIDREAGRSLDFDARVRRAMAAAHAAGPRPRVPPQPFYANPWPECFCLARATSPPHACPSHHPPNATNPGAF
ncbi:O-fucosyltransferase family protein [Wolffia australiana]